jgi:hypothetical protein
MAMSAQRKNYILFAFFLLLSLAIYAYTWTLLPRGAATLVAAIPAIPTILLARYFFKKVQAAKSPE